MASVTLDAMPVTEVEQREPHLMASVTLDAMPVTDPREMAALAASVRGDYRKALRLTLELQGAYGTHEELPRDPERFAYFIAAALPATASTRQRLLESSSVDQLLASEAKLMRRLLRDLNQLLTNQRTTRLN